MLLDPHPPLHCIALHCLALPSNLTHQRHAGAERNLGAVDLREARNVRGLGQPEALDRLPHILPELQPLGLHLQHPLDFGYGEYSSGGDDGKRRGGEREGPMRCVSFRMRTRVLNS